MMPGTRDAARRGSRTRARTSRLYILVIDCITIFDCIAFDARYPGCGAQGIKDEGKDESTGPSDEDRCSHPHPAAAAIAPMRLSRSKLSSRTTGPSDEDRCSYPAPAPASCRRRRRRRITNSSANKPEYTVGRGQVLFPRPRRRIADETLKVESAVSDAFITHDGPVGRGQVLSPPRRRRRRRRLRTRARRRDLVTRAVCQARPPGGERSEPPPPITLPRRERSSRRGGGGVE